MSDKKCDKCGCDMKLVLEEKGDFFITKIYRCTNLRCGYMERILKNK